MKSQGTQTEPTNATTTVNQTSNKRKAVRDVNAQNSASKKKKPIQTPVRRSPRRARKTLFFK